jgi:cardiolipin synthase
VRRAEEVHLERWRQRGLWHKLKDNTVYLINELL